MPLPKETIDIVSSPLVQAFAAWLIAAFVTWLAQQRHITLTAGTQNGLRTAVIVAFGAGFYAVFRYGSPELQEVVRALNAITIASAAGSAAFSVMHTQAVRQANRALELDEKHAALKRQAAPPTVRAVAANRPVLDGANG